MKETNLNGSELSSLNDGLLLVGEGKFFNGSHFSVRCEGRGG